MSHEVDYTAEKNLDRLALVEAIAHEALQILKVEAVADPRHEKVRNRVHMVWELLMHHNEGTERAFGLQRPAEYDYEDDQAPSNPEGLAAAILRETPSKALVFQAANLIEELCDREGFDLVRVSVLGEDVRRNFRIDHATPEVWTTEKWSLSIFLDPGKP
jgi:hypothetical protein